MKKDTAGETAVLKYAQFHIKGGQGVQINCIECGSKAIINSRADKDIKVIDLYCSCKDPLCGHTFVSTLSFSHTLSPSAKQSDKMIMDFLRSMPKDKQLNLLKQASIQ